ncbi:MAG: hypothetical protein IJK03_01755 [Oscillospiraceae bacterium]|nr:hypothetical protein [Oscillospiraceae bacterium]
MLPIVERDRVLLPYNQYLEQKHAAYRRESFLLSLFCLYRPLAIVIEYKQPAPARQSRKSYKKEETSWTVEVVPARQQAEVKRTYALSVRFP